jgi:hypothetical protein
MSHCQDLEKWSEEAQAKRGLIHVDFFPGPNRELDIEVAAEAALTLLQGNEFEDDVTQDNL